MKPRIVPKPLPEQERGQSLTELALLLPFLIILILGTLDLARAYDMYVSLQNAAREGARYAIADPTNTTGLATRINQELTGTGITGVTIAAPECTTIDKTSNSTDTTGIACADAVQGDYVTIKISHSFKFVSFSVIGLSDITMNTQATMAIAKP